MGLELDVASFPGPAQLSVACSTVKRERDRVRVMVRVRVRVTVSDGKLGGAWERG